MAVDNARLLLRHTVATVAYRGRKAIHDVPGAFAEFRLSPTSRTPSEILSHIGDVFDWALALSDGQHVWGNSPTLTWSEQVARFFEALRKFDERLATDAPLACLPERLFQGPIADALTHIGQIAMLRRVAGFPVRGENYFKADIVAGRTGVEQRQPRGEFD